MNELTKRTEHLPDTIEDLNKFILFTRKQLHAQILKIQAIDGVGMAKSIRDAALADTQNMAEVLLRAEAKMGEKLKAIPSEQGTRTDKKKEPLSTKGQKLKELGIDQHQRHYAETLASYPQAIERAIEQAKQHEEVPTRAAVLRAIKRETHPPKPREAKQKPKPESESESKNPSLEELQRIRAKEWKNGRPLMSQSFRNAVDELKREIIRAKKSGWKETGRQVALDYVTGLINIIKF